MPPRSELKFLNLGHFLDHYFLLIFPTAVLAIERDWGMSYGAALALGTPAFVVFAAVTLPVGWLGDRYPRRHLMALFFLGCGGASLAIGFAPGPFWLMAGLGALGLFAAIYHPVGIAMITERAARPGHALAVAGVWGNMGLAAASLVSGYLAAHLGWRAAFLLPGAVAVAVGLVYLLLGRRRACRRSALPKRAIPAAAVAATNRRKVIRVLVFVVLAALIGGLIFNGVILSLPKLLAERLPDVAGDLTVIGGYSALIFAVAAFAQLPVGRLLDSGRLIPLLIVLFAGQTLLLVLTASAVGIAIVPAAMLLVLTMFAWIPVTDWLIGRHVPANWRSRVIAVAYTLSLGSTALVLPAIALMHSNGFGFAAQYLLLAAGAALVFCAISLLPGRAASTRAIGARALS